MNENLPLARPIQDLETAVSHGDKIELRVWLRLLTCSAMIEKRVRAGLRERFGITLPRFDLLAQLDRAPEGLTMGELSGRLMVSNGNVTGLTDRLVEEGLVVREAESHDRRTQRVRLTPAGKRAFDAMTPENELWVENTMAGLGRDELQQLYALLGRLKESVKAAGAAADEQP